MTAVANEQAIRTFQQGLKEGDAAKMASALTEDSVFVFPRPTMTGTVIRGGRRIGDFLSALVKDNYKRMEWHYGALLADDRHGMAEWRLTGLTINDADYDQFYCFTFDFECGRIKEIREYIDTAWGQRLLGAEGGKTIKAFVDD